MALGYYCLARENVARRQRVSHQDVVEISLVSLPLTGTSLQPLEIVHVFAGKHVCRLLQLSKVGGV